jgi:hypothetical protein
MVYISFKKGDQAMGCYLHPSIVSSPSFLDLYYQYYDLLKLRGQVYALCNEILEYGSIIDPKLIGDLECDLEVIRAEETKLRASILTVEEMKPGIESLQSQKSEIFRKLDSYGRNAFLDYQESPPSANMYEIQIEYCNYKINALEKKIEEFRTKTFLRDPFQHLEISYNLTREEMEVLIYLYFSDFEHGSAIKGNILLANVIGRQQNIFRDQSFLHPDSSLVRHDLVTTVERQYDWMSSTYAISPKANLIISGLHADFPHLDVQWKSTPEQSNVETSPINAAKEILRIAVPLLFDEYPSGQIAQLRDRIAETAVVGIDPNQSCLVLRALGKEFPFNTQMSIHYVDYYHIIDRAMKERPLKTFICLLANYVCVSEQKSNWTLHISVDSTA